MNEFREPTAFVSKTDQWDQQRLYHAMQDKGFAWASGPDGGMLQIATMAEDQLFYRPQPGTFERKKYDIVQDWALKALGEQNSQADTLISTIIERTGYGSDFVEGCIRLLVAYGEANATMSREAVRLDLSAEGKRSEGQRSFAASFAHELSMQAERIAMLVSHGPTVGNYREELLRELLQNHIPQRFHAATGFVAGFEKQLDIIIYDRMEHAPLFQTGNLVVVPPESVRAIIEVKSTLSVQKLKEALAHINGFRLMAGGPHLPPIFCGIFAFRRPGSSGALASAIAQYYRHSLDIELGENTSMFTAYDHVDAVCVLKQDLFTIQYARIKAEDGQIILTPIVVSLGNSSERELQAAWFFHRLSRFLRYPFDGKKDGMGLATMFGGETMPLSTIAINGSELWGPYDPMAKEIAEDMDVDQVLTLEGELRRFQNWLDGGIWAPVQRHNYRHGND